MESSAGVRINVTDSNTHKPVFQQCIYRQRISEATSVDGRVLIVKATDGDQGLNAKLTYAIEVSATDHGNLLLKGTANVHITVTDVNGNKPRFLQSNYEKSILENVQPGTEHGFGSLCS